MKGLIRGLSLIRGDSMETEFREGDIIVINPYLKPEHNDYVVIENDEGETTFKQLKKYGKTRVLHLLNPKYDDMELTRDIEYRIVGVVMEKKKAISYHLILFYTFKCALRIWQYDF